MPAMSQQQLRQEPFGPSELQACLSPPPTYDQSPPTKITVAQQQQTQQPGAPPPPQPVYNQPPPAYYPQPASQQQSQQTVIIQQPRLGVMGGYGPSPVTMGCPYCSANITSSTKKQCGSMVWMVAGIICFIGLFVPFVWFGCCLIPFCIPSLYDVEHSCPSCLRTLGTHKAGGSL